MNCRCCEVTQRSISNTFNTLQQLSRVTDGSDLTYADYTYTADGQASTALYPNGIRVEWGYDSAGRIGSILHRVVSTNVVLIGCSAPFGTAQAPCATRIQSNGSR